MSLTDDIRSVQVRLGVRPDGLVGAQTVAAMRTALDELEGLRPVKVPATDPSGPLTVKVALELIGHEAIIQEAYKDSVGVWTWGVGVTSRSGHSVERYKDNPQPIRRCLEIYLWLLQTRYMPDVLTEFAGCKLTEAQFAAALSFHYNTGAIKRASWVDLWLAGRVEVAKSAMMEWDRPSSIIGRRQKERDLFFDGQWSQDGKATVYPVRKPSYTPHWGGAKRIDVRADIEALLGAGS